MVNKPLRIRSRDGRPHRRRLGVLCLKFSADFWLATAIANAVWLLGDAVGHVRQMTLDNNHASNNSGIFLVTEIIMPLVILSLTLYHRRQEGKVS
jgi:hypothetical protein